MSSERPEAGRFPTPDLVVQETGAYVPEQQAYLNIMRTAEVLGAQLTELFARHGLSGKQYNALRAIRRGGELGLTASEIGEQMTDRRADVTRLVDRLEREGRVERRHDATDRRVVRAVLTDDGAELLRTLDGPLVETHRRQLGHLSTEEVEMLIVLLRKARHETEAGRQTQGS